MDAGRATGLRQAFRESLPLPEGARRVGDPIAVLPVLYHLLWTHVVAVDLDSRSPVRLVRSGGQRRSRPAGGSVTSWRSSRASRMSIGRTVHGLDAGEDEIDAGQELLAVVMFGQLRPGLVHGWVSGGVELRPPCGDGGEES